MPFITFAERYGRREGLLQGIELALELKFGAEGQALVPEVRKQTDLAVLQAVFDAIKPAASAEDVRKLLSGNGQQK